jgi:hypothetical protein
VEEAGMSQSRLEAQRIIALTAEIESAREALHDEDTPANRERLTAAEADYKAYLIGLNGLEDACPWPASPL